MQVQTSKMKKAELELMVADLQQKLDAATPEGILISEPPAVPKPSKFKISLTITLGTAIPLLSLALSSVAGTLASKGHFALSGFAFFLMAAVLSVSLPHLAHAIGEITNSPKLASWALAIALDLSLVLCELVSTWASDSGVGGITITVTASVCVISQVLNCWAFLNPSK